MKWHKIRQRENMLIQNLNQNNLGVVALTNKNTFNVNAQSISQSLVG